MTHPISRMSVVFNVRPHSLLCRYPVLAMAEVSVRLSVCLSHRDTVQAKITSVKLKSRHLYCQLPKRFSPIHLSTAAISRLFCSYDRTPEKYRTEI